MGCWGSTGSYSISLASLVSGKSLSIISHKGFRSNTLKRIWLSFPREINPCCVIILSRNQRPLPALETVICLVHSLWPAPVTGLQLPECTAITTQPFFGGWLTIYTSHVFQSSPPKDVLNELWNLIIIRNMFIGQNMFQFPSNQLQSDGISTTKWIGTLVSIWPNFLYLLQQQYNTPMRQAV